MIKAILFDLDGVLIDACEIHRRALNRSLLEVIGYEISEPDHYTIYNGLPTKSKIDILIKSGVEISSFQKLEISRLKQEYTLFEIENLSLDLTKRQMLAILHERGFSLGCVTNSIELTSHTMLRKTGILDLFDTIISNELVKNPKPDPEGYYLAMKNLQVEPEETIIFEDSQIGIKAATATECKKVVITTVGILDLNFVESILRDIHE